MGRNNTKAVKNIAKMYEQLGLAQDDIFHKTKLLLSIYRDVVWATLADCNCVNEEIYYYGDDLTDTLSETISRIRSFSQTMDFRVRPSTDRVLFKWRIWWSRAW